jgi:hypothetical protein
MHASARMRVSALFRRHALRKVREECPFHRSEQWQQPPSAVSAAAAADDPTIVRERARNRDGGRPVCVCVCVCVCECVCVLVCVCVCACVCVQ